MPFLVKILASIHLNTTENGTYNFQTIKPSNAHNMGLYNICVTRICSKLSEFKANILLLNYAIISKGCLNGK